MAYDANFSESATFNATFAGNAIDAVSNEVIDIRTAYDGTVYPSAGDAVRGQIEEAMESGGGLTDDAKQALLQIARKVAYIDEEGASYYGDLYDAFYPPVHATSVALSPSTLSFATLNTRQQITATITPDNTTDIVNWSSSNTAVATVDEMGQVTAVGYGGCTITCTVGTISATCGVVVAQATLVSISAVYTQSGNVYDTDSLDSLKTDLVVTATWSNQTTSVVPSTDYTLSGSLVVGTSTITVTYGSATDTFDVVVTSGVTTVTIDSWANYGGVQTRWASSNYIDARNGELYITIPFVDGDTNLTAGTTATSKPYGVMGALFTYENEEYTRVGYYYNGQINESYTASGVPTQMFDTKVKVAPSGYYVKPILLKNSAVFSSNAKGKAYATAHVTTAELRTV